MLRQAEDAVAILCAPLMREAAAMGLLVAGETDGLWQFPFNFEIVNGLYILSDLPGDEPDCVMAVGGTTRLLAAASYPQEDVGSALDLGCGCGVLALLIAAAARRVVATDINPRALQFAGINAAINGIDNVEFRAGSLYQSVEGERFDLIVAQPPFYPRCEGTETVWYLHGGERGDELAMQMLSGAQRHLTPSGIAILLANFPQAEQPLVNRIRAIVDGGAMLAAVLDTPVESILEMATLAAATGDESVLRAARTLHARLKREAIACVEQAVIALTAQHDWTREIRIPADGWNALHRQHLDSAIHLEAMSSADLRAARLAWAPDVEQCIRSFAERPAESVIEFRPPADDAWLGALRTSHSGRQIITDAATFDTVEQALHAMDGAFQHEAEELLRDAIRAGVLRIQS
jgi:methylase of polypeptide subunit release factors